jgi:hypothetical protein
MWWSEVPVDVDAKTFAILQGSARDMLQENTKLDSSQHLRKTPVFSIRFPQSIVYLKIMCAMAPSLVCAVEPVRSVIGNRMTDLRDG